MAARTPYVGSESTGDVLTAANFDKLPNGLVAYKINDTATTAIGTAGKDLNNMGITYTFLADRFYEFRCRIRMGNPSGAQTAWVDLQTGSTIWAHMCEIPFSGAGSDYFILTGSALYTPPAGSTSVKLRGDTTTGTWEEGPGGTYPDNTGPDTFAIYDWGPVF